MKIVLAIAVGLLFLDKAPAQKSGTVYYFLFNVDPELTEYVKEEDKSKTWFSGYSEEEAMPDELLDSILRKTEHALWKSLVRKH